MAIRHSSEGPTAGDRAEPLAEGCLAHNTIADVLEMMSESGVDLMPVLGSFEGGEILGFVHRVALENAETVGTEDVTVADAWWLEAPRVPADLPLVRILEAPDRAHVYLVLDAAGRPVGILRPDTVAWPDVPSKRS